VAPEINDALPCHPPPPRFDVTLGFGNGIPTYTTTTTKVKGTKVPKTHPENQVIIYEGARAQPGRKKSKKAMLGRMAPVVHRNEHHVHRLLRDHLGVSHPGRQYLATITDGFDVDSHSAYVPYGSTTSQKVTVRVAFDLAAGTLGNGFVALLPHPGNDRDSAQFSLASYAGTPSFAGRTNAVNTAASGVACATPYSTGVLGGTNGTGSPNYNWRCVGASARLHYTGTELNRGGTVYAVIHPQSQLIPNTSTGGQIYATFSNTVKYNINTQSTYEVHWHARQDIQLEFCNNLTTTSNRYAPTSLGNSGNLYYDFTSASAGASGDNSFGFLIAGANPGATFTCELVIHWEYSGPSIGMLATPVVSDAASIHKVRGIVEHATISHASDPATPRVKHVENSVSTVATLMEPSNAAAIAGLVGGAGAAAAVGIGATVYQQNREPINKLVNNIASGVSSIFGRK